MKICVTSTGPNMNAPVDPRFGRCQYFMIVDLETMEHEAMPNPNISVSGGAGIQAANTVASKGVGVVVTGNVGPNATQTLGAAGIQIVTGASGTIDDAIEQYKSGRLQQTSSPTVPEYSGIGGAGVGAGAGAGMGGGGGMGRGGGRGGGRGMGGGMGIGMSVPITPAPAAPTVPPQTKEQEIQTLEDTIKTLDGQMEYIKKRLEELKR
ncbi:MAG: dinitrogenase iron-molybdenum cofactor biosynthesis protein [Methanosarcinaceae archaeon]|nr:dinitrogenase iron-molybdenum cofactor biosynthesis protein [Methanosarcinaceae archaeon]